MHNQQARLTMSTVVWIAAIVFSHLLNVPANRSLTLDNSIRNRNVNSAFRSKPPPMHPRAKLSSI